MDQADIVVIGAGISGLSLAWRAAQSGRRALVLEKQGRIGGCVYSRRFGDGYWHELGAHTVYNSYAGLLDIIRGAGVADQLVQRGPARAWFGLLRGDQIEWLTPPKVLFRLSWLEAALHLPVGLFRRRQGRTVAQHYRALLGPRNFDQVLAPFFAAVPSQRADAFPVVGPGSLFKKRSRNQGFPRSFGFSGGLQTVCDAMGAHNGIEVRVNAPVTGLRAVEGRFEVSLEGGARITAARAAVALPPAQASKLLKEGFPTLADAIGRIETAAVESMGARVEARKCPLPPCAFVVPVNDAFFSAVARDPFPDPDWRGFAFHFRPGLTAEEKVGRMARLLRVSPADLDGLAENRLTLPAPRVNHAALLDDIQRALEATGLALTGNYFAGLAIEDCIARSNDEWRRISSG